MIGSFGTLAAIAAVNFKLLPAPEREHSFLLPFPTVTKAIAVRGRILANPLQPAAIDLLNPAAAASFGGRGWLLAVRTGGNPAAMPRNEAEMAYIAGRLAAETECPESFWPEVENFTPQFLHRRPDGAVVRVSCTLKGLAAVMESFPGPAIGRAASGVCYGYFEQADAIADWFARAKRLDWKAVVEFASEARKRTLELWPSPGGDFEIMRRIKALFDPSNLLNRGRLYRRI
jgi:glycolate oxidase FAD binding subunit